MKSLRFAFAPLAFALSLPSTAAIAQNDSQLTAIAPTSTLLAITAEARSARKPDLAVFSAGVASQGKTAAAALAANSADMNRVIAALKAAGIADRDIQTSNLNLNPVYAQPVIDPNGQMENQEPRIIGYQASNQVSVRQRNLTQFGRVLDTLVSAGANQINGPSFDLENSNAAMDEARTAAMAKARQRAELYARAAGLKVKRIVAISEAGGFIPPMPAIYAKAEIAPGSAPTPISAGEVALTATVSVQFELAP
ncbi:MAG: SIMPL domain-containing protein [Novosphingobium sp.]|jgi:uncharacterized protein YggE|nr:SIMPL domain-containing protein [Brevundimonas sp.]MCZ8323106.1 SIMPL domain-containing protein [Novosphingobium sp.]